MRQGQRRNVREAQRVFNELPPEQQMTLTKEQVETRAEELHRAYENLIQVSYGYRLRRRKDKGGTRVVRKPCVIFIVDKKWSDGAGHSDDALPKFLYAYCTVNGERKLCAIPTDVDEAEQLLKLKPEALPGIEVTASAATQAEPGSITCAVQRSSQPDMTYIISCRHVFSLSETLHPEQRVSAVQLRGGGKSLGITLKVTGVLQDEPPLSFDAQLAEMTDAEALRTALNDIRFLDYAHTQDDFPPEYWVITPHGPVKVHFVQIIKPSFPLDYSRSGINKVVHEELVVSHFTTADKTGRGDSGSPVATEKTGGVLLGMHIAGSDDRTGTIPAWQLLSPKNYKRAASTETWSLLNPEEVQVTSPAAGPVNGGDLLADLTVNHRFQNSVAWCLARDGIRIEDAPPEVTQGEPQTVNRVWNSFGESIKHWAAHFGVPIELIIATICTESSGKREAVRREPGYVSDQATPGKISVGLMQTLISTARETLPDISIDRQWLLDADNSIQAGTAYIAKQKSTTAFDPPKVACAYNAGSLRLNNAAGNRWKMRQFPADTSEHADRFVKWFNDCFRLFEQLAISPSPSFREMLS
jgi:hypothetical protein